MAACAWSRAISAARCSRPARSTRSAGSIEAPARCFSDQNEVLEAFKAGELDRDCAVVVRFQGPRANGMPELHKLTPTLGVLQDRGHRVALITDGRMSGASGKVPAAIHVSPEALPDGPLARVRDGDVIRLDAHTGTLEAVGVDLAARPPANSPPPPTGTGRELFAMMRMHCKRRRSRRFGDARRDGGRAGVRHDRRCRRWRNPRALRARRDRGRAGRVA